MPVSKVEFILYEMKYPKASRLCQTSWGCHSSESSGHALPSTRTEEFLPPIAAAYLYSSGADVR